MEENDRRVLLVRSSSLSRNEREGGRRTESTERRERGRDKGIQVSYLLVSWRGKEEKKKGASKGGVRKRRERREGKF